MAAFAGFGLTIASEQDPTRFGEPPLTDSFSCTSDQGFFLGSLSSSYLATEGLSNDQLTFFRYPKFDPSK
jgi:hypothetical protein